MSDMAIYQQWLRRVLGSSQVTRITDNMADFRVEYARNL